MVEFGGGWTEWAPEKGEANELTGAEAEQGGPTDGLGGGGGGGGGGAAVQEKETAAGG